ncbi:hypothetical protein [Pseudonocardia lacus]|uniref:hypothetical protein n=1 Tax=Pseudonocardia lacus TaxID=2835865 RepID=UPI001BDC2719|nr:hypothetical protein [Pseudonocardia lacus]
MDVLDVGVADERGDPPPDALTTAIPLLRDTLVRIADEARHSMVVTDPDGRVLWRDTRRGPGSRTRHRWTSAACPVHDADAGAVIGAVDVTGPARSIHPTTPALVAAAAMLTESLLVAQQAVQDELMLARHLPLLDGTDGEPAALLALTGRVLACRPDGWLAERVAVGGGDRVPVGDGVAVLDAIPGGWLMRLRRRPG